MQKEQRFLPQHNKGCSQFIKIFTSKKVNILLYSVLFSLLFAIGFSSNHSSIMAADKHVYDDANVLSKEECSSLEKQISELEQQVVNFKINSDVNFYILTTNDLGGISFKKYMENFADNMNVTNCAILLISFDPNNRVFEIQGYGTVEAYLTYTRINHIFDKMQSDLSDGKYFKACHTYLTESSEYLNADIESSKNDSIIHKIWFQAILSLCLGGIIVIVMVIQSGGKTTVTQNTYLDKNNSRVLAKRDIYVNTHVTKTKRIEHDNDNTGSGTSSGGHSHSGGGGRSF